MCAKWMLIVAAGVLTFPECTSIAQSSSSVPGYTDPEPAAISAKRQALEQEERNIKNEQLSLGVFKYNAAKIRRQTEALAIMSADNLSPRLPGDWSDVFKTSDPRVGAENIISLGRQGSDEQFWALVTGGGVKRTIPQLKAMLNSWNPGSGAAPLVSVRRNYPSTGLQFSTP